MFTIELNGLTFTGSLMDVTSKYLCLKQMLGGNGGWAHWLTVTDPSGERFDMENWVAGARALFGVESTDSDWDF